MNKAGWDHLKPKDSSKLRDQLLARQIRFQLYAYSTFYRKAMDEAGLKPDAIQGLDDLGKLPLVDRGALAAATKEFFLRPTRQQIQKWGAGKQVTEVLLEMMLRGADRCEQLVRNEYETVHTLHTAGVEGKPLAIRLSKYDLVTLSTQGKRMFEVAGIGPSDTILNLLEHDQACGFLPAWLGGVEIAVKQTAPGLIEPQQAIEIIKRESSTVLIVRAQDAVSILDPARRLPSSVKTILMAPGPAAKTLRDRIVSLAGPGVKVLGSYSFAEGRAWWVECAEGGLQGGYHTYPDTDIIEVIGPENHWAPLDCPGELIFTGLDQRGTALARYRPGDRVTALMTGSCPYCGRAVDRIAGPISRLRHVVEVRVDGGLPKSIDDGVLAAVLSHPGLAAWQVEIRQGPRGSISDDLFVLYRINGGADPAHVAVDLDLAWRDRLGFSPTQFVLSDRADGTLTDLRAKQVH